MSLGGSHPKIPLGNYHRLSHSDLGGAAGSEALAQPAAVAGWDARCNQNSARGGAECGLREAIRRAGSSSGGCGEGGRAH